MNNFNVSVYDSCPIHASAFDDPKNPIAGKGAWFFYHHETMYWKEFIEKKQAGNNPLPFPTLNELLCTPLNERGKGVYLIIFSFEEELTYNEMIESFQELYNYVSEKEILNFQDYTRKYYLKTFFQETNNDKEYFVEGKAKSMGCTIIKKYNSEGKWNIVDFIIDFLSDDDIKLVEKYLCEYKDTEINCLTS